MASYARAHVHGLGRIPRDTGARSAATLPTDATATCLQASALAEASPGGTLFSSLGSSSARTLAWCSASWTTRPAVAAAVPAAAPAEQGAGQGPRRGRYPNPGLPDRRQLARQPRPRRRTCGCARACWSCCARCSAPQAAPLQQTSLFQVGMFTRCGMPSPTACLLGSAVVVLCPCNTPPAASLSVPMLSRRAPPPAPPPSRPSRRLLRALPLCPVPQAVPQPASRPPGPLPVPPAHGHPSGAGSQQEPPHPAPLPPAVGWERTLSACLAASHRSSPHMLLAVSLLCTPFVCCCAR